jgi:hypothetical protein
MPSFFERVLRPSWWTTKIGPLKRVAPACGHVYRADTFLPPTFQYREQVNPGTVESLCSSLDVMVPCAPHLLHRGFVNFATGVKVALSLAARIFGKEEWQRT